MKAKRNYLIAFALLILVAIAVAAGSPQNFILQLQNAGTAIATFANYGVLNCSTGLNCSASGSTVTITASGAGLPSLPTTPNSVAESICSTPSGGVGGAAAWCLAGVGGRSYSGTTDTVLAADRTSWVISTGGSASVQTLPQAGSTSFANNFAYGVKVTGAGTVTITPTTSTIDGNATLVVTQGQNCTIASLDNTNYVSRCSSGQVTVGSSLTSTPSANGTVLSIPAGLMSCAVLDNAICTSAVDGSGNPNFLGTAGNTTLPINGGTTPLVMFIGGVYQVLNSNVTLAVSATSTTQQWIIAKQDLTNANMIAGDFVASLTPPVYAYTAPTCPTSPQGVAVSATFPAYWFDLSTNLSKLCTSNGGAYAASPALPLGVVDVDATPKVDAVAAEPFRLNPYKRRELYGDGSNGSLSVSAGSNIIGTLNANGNVTVGAAGSGYTNGTQALTITSCGAVVNVTVAGNAVTGISSIGSAGTSPCIVANGYATTGGGGTGATLNIISVLSIPLQLTSFNVTGGTVTSSDWTPQIQPSNRALGLIVFSLNPIMVLNSASVNADALAKTTVIAGPGTPASNEIGGLGGCSGGGGGGVVAGAAGSSCEKAMTLIGTDNGVAGGVGAAGGNALIGPQVTSLPFANNYWCVYGHWMGASGGPGGGDNSAKKGGTGGRGGSLVCLRAPAIYIASTATVSANGGNGGAGESGGGNTGGGAAGGGGTVDIRGGYLSITGATITANAGSVGAGTGAGGAGGTSAPGQVIKQKQW